MEVILEDFFLGSLETTGTLVCWSIMFMVQNPNVQNKVRQVILEKMASKGEGVLPAAELKRLTMLIASKHSSTGV